MAVSGIGGIGGGGPSVPLSGLSTAPAGSATPEAASAGANLSAADALPPGLQSLVDILKDFSSAEILLALMFAAAAGKEDDREGGSAAGAFLAGLALAGQLGQSAELNLSLEIPQFPDAGTGGAGLALNVTV